MGVVRRKQSGKYETHEGIMYVPDALSPTGFREYCVTEAAWQKRRKELAERAASHCEKCLRLSPYPQPGGPAIAGGDGAHIRSTGAGGDDSLANLLWLCRLCHRLSHQPKAVPRKQ